MAVKCLLSKKILSFHENAVGILWQNFDPKLQFLYIALLRITGLGFLITAMLLLIVPVANYFIHDKFIKYTIPVIALIFSMGICIVNYNLHKQTQANTPWIGAIFVMSLITLGLLVTLLS